MQAILAEVSIAVQVGGGIRTRGVAERWLAAGAERIVLGTVAVRDPELARALCEEHPGRVVIAIDARGDEVAVEGLARGQRSERARAGRARGRLGRGRHPLHRHRARRNGRGPAVERTAALQARVGATVIASGGIGAIAHLAALREAGVRAAVCGRALYEGAFSLREAMAAARGEG
ncbi:MAG: HisA/HisF-related TIM barrel protein [Sandaracinaceae bacterium]|nr:HisA/HisF-related TIM barrel protein [Sandaracinaceae bacterium]